MSLKSDLQMISTRTKLLVFIIALMLSSLPLNPVSYSLTTSYTGTLYYIVQLSISSSNGFSIPVECVIKASVVRDEIRAAEIINLNYLSTFNLPPDILKIIEYSLKYWLGNIELFNHVKSNTETYVSIESKIVKAYVITLGGTIQYREVNTGFYLGGIVNNVFYRSVTGTYRINLISYLYKLSPDTILKQFAVIEPPREKVMLFGTIILLIILGGVIHTFYRWKDYKLT